MVLKDAMSEKVILNIFISLPFATFFFHRRFIFTCWLRSPQARQTLSVCPEKEKSQGWSFSTRTREAFSSCKAAATSLTLPPTAWKKNKNHFHIRGQQQERVQTNTCSHPVTVPPTPAEPYEPEFDRWVVSSDSFAFSAVLSSHEDAVSASLCLHRSDASVQLHKSEETKP